MKSLGFSNRHIVNELVSVDTSGGELYIGVYTDYWENDGALCRLNNQTYLRTERDDRQQLNGSCLKW